MSEALLDKKRNGGKQMLATDPCIPQKISEDGPVLYEPTCRAVASLLLQHFLKCNHDLKSRKCERSNIYFVIVDSKILSFSLWKVKV